MINDNASFFLHVLENLTKDGYPWHAVPGYQKQKTYETLPFNTGFFQSIVDQAAVGIMVFNGETIVYANERLRKIFQCAYEPGEEACQNFISRFASNRTKATILDHNERIRGGIDYIEPFVGEFVLTEERKMFFEMHSHGLKVSNSFWQICFMIDVSEKFQARIELDQRIHRFESIINGMDAATWEWDIIKQEGIYNNNWMKMIGYHPADLAVLRNKFWSEVAHPDDAGMLNELLRQLTTGAIDALNFEARVRHKEGHWIWILSRGRITDWTASGLPRTISGANIDITDKKMAEAKLLHSKEELERSVAALSIASHTKEDFLSTMSHEIRTPLNAVIGLTNLLLRRNPRADQLEIVKTVKNAGDNLLHLVNNILDYNKIEAGKLELESIIFNFRDFLEHLYSIFKLDAHDKNIDLQVKADPQIPDILQGDITRLNQIFTNLLGNSLKFTKKGKVELDVFLVSSENGVCTIRFVITDTGIGIHPSKIEKIFQPFHQSDVSITRQFGGTGLGLSIIKGLVKMFDGTIDVASSPGHGSSFTVTLKLLEQTTSPYAARKTCNEFPLKSNKLNILYVEDVASNRFLVSSLMEELSFNCTIANSGYEALEKTLNETYDVILMDIQMPGIDGYETAERIFIQPGGKNASTPIIAFTAEPVTEALKEKLRLHKMRDVIGKPFDIGQFAEKLSDLSIDQHGTREYSLDFYSRAAYYENSPHIYGLVADEIYSFTRSLFEAYHHNDTRKVREETHKLRPIINNLRMITVMKLIDQLQNFDQAVPEMLDVINAIETKIDPILKELRSKVKVGQDG